IKRIIKRIKEKLWIIITTLLILLFILIFMFDYIFITIYPGHAGVLFKRIFNKGTVIDKICDEGMNIIFPWNKIYDYDIRIQEKKQSVSVLSQNGLTIKVDVSIRFHLIRSELPVLHKRVGPDYRDKIIIPSIISSVREVVGDYRPEEIYTTARHLIQDNLLIEVIEETGRVPIIYDDIIVETIVLPDLINEAIEMKLKQRQEYLEYEFRVKKAEREIERKEKDAIGIRQYQNIITESLSPELLKWKGIMATLELAQSPNTKVIIVGGGKNGLPIIFNADAGGSSLSVEPLNPIVPDNNNDTEDSITEEPELETGQQPLP
ncbi:MAG: prohibitin family protein, partial [Thermodesulfobacteriota bacterium]|nr:prohibitin family protein [Thermodesulfobacteriota bacterium]